MSNTAARAAALKSVKAITADRAVDILKVRAREQEAVENWAKEYIKVRGTGSESFSRWRQHTDWTVLVVRKGSGAVAL
jgi:hypothetical protein